MTGLGAAQIDFLHAVCGNFPCMLAIIALLTVVLLDRAFRSILLPIKAIVLNLVSLGSTLGVLVVFWQDAHGSNIRFGIEATGAVACWIPIIVFVFLFGLSMDYEVFILSRMREEYDESESTDGAVIEGIDLKTLATGLGIGILLDATIVRSILLPSLVSLFGSWNWYLPAGLAKALRVRAPATLPAIAMAEPAS